MICVVTDRRHADVVEQARRAADAGVDLFQIRERDLDAKPLADLLAAVQRVTRGSSIRVVVNDRLDVALAHSADGVHLRGDSIPVADARRLASPPFLVGRSVHSAGEAAASHGADYLIAGAVFPTASKPSDTRWLGLDGLRLRPGLVLHLDAEGGAPRAEGVSGSAGSDFGRPAASWSS